MKAILRSCMLLTLCVAGCSDPDHEYQPIDWVTVREIEFRRTAIQKPTPAYPSVSLRNGISGVAVADLLLGRDGHVEKVEILEAPDLLTAAEVREAARQWTFETGWMNISRNWSSHDKHDDELHDVDLQVARRAPYANELLPIRTKLTFYFEITNGTGIVASPSEITARSVPLEGTSPPTLIDESEFRRIVAARENVILLDVSERTERVQRANLKHIPWDEVEARAPIELPLSTQVVVACVRPRWCRVAGQHLASAGFSRVMILAATERSAS